MSHKTDEDIREEVRQSHNRQHRLLLMILDRLEDLCTIVIQRRTWTTAKYKSRMPYIQDNGEEG